MIQWLQQAKDEHEEHCSKPQCPNLDAIVNRLNCQNIALRKDNDNLLDMNNELCAVVEGFLEVFECRERYGRDHSSSDLEVIVNQLIGRNNALISQNNELQSRIANSGRSEHLSQMRVISILSVLGLLFWNIMTWSDFCRYG